jgi:hypothetical protein
MYKLDERSHHVAIQRALQKAGGKLPCRLAGFQNHFGQYDCCVSDGSGCVAGELPLEEGQRCGAPQDGTAELARVQCERFAQQLQGGERGCRLRTATCGAASHRQMRSACGALCVCLYRVDVQT